MKDVYGNNVINGDFMFESHDDYAYIFKVENNQPILSMTITEEAIEKFDMKDIEETINTLNSKQDVSGFIKNYFIKLKERIGNLTIDSLIKLENEEIINRILEYKANK